MQTNLIDPQRTLSVYLVGMCSMLAAVLLNSRLRRKTPLLSDRLNSTQINSIGVGCFLLYLLPVYILPAQWAGTYNQFDYFEYLAIMLPVYQLARDSDGRRTFNWVSFIVWLYVTVVLGILSFSKEGIFVGSAAWIIAAAAAGYRVTLKKGVTLAVTALAAVLLFTPFSQVGRLYRGDGNVVSIVVNMLTHPLETQAIYSKSQADILQSDGLGSSRWFNQPEGFLERLTVVPIDDVLIYVTDHGQPGSLDVLKSYWLNLVPRYL